MEVVIISKSQSFVESTTKE